MRRNDKPRFIATRVRGVRISRSDRDNGALGGLVHFRFRWRRGQPLNSPLSPLTVVRGTTTKSDTWNIPKNLTPHVVNRGGIS